MWLLAALRLSQDFKKKVKARRTTVGTGELPAIRPRTASRSGQVFPVADSQT